MAYDNNGFDVETELHRDTGTKWNLDGVDIRGYDTNGKHVGFTPQVRSGGRRR